MKRAYLFLILLISHPVLSWYCQDVASERNGSVITACGIAQAMDEDVARKTALNNAYKELDLICSHSSDCSNRALEISPLRTDCKKILTGYRCHRGITATITSKERNLQQKTFLEEVFVPKKIIEIDSQDQLAKSSIVDFNTEPFGATVYVDGVEVCKTSCSREIKNGEHKVLFELPDFDIFSKTYLITDVRLSISEKLTSTYGYLKLLGVPDKAVVKIDNKEISARESIRLIPNQHIVAIQSKYHQSWHKKFDISKGQKLLLNYDAEALMAYLKISASDSNDNPVEATISINGKASQYKTPTLIKVSSGESIICLSYPGHEDRNLVLTLEPGQNKEIKEKLDTLIDKRWTMPYEDLWK